MKKISLHFKVGLSFLLLSPFSKSLALEIVDYGSLRIHYYETSETLSTYNAERSFSENEKAVVAGAAQYLESTIGNVGARDVNIHMMWASGLSESTLGSSSSSAYILTTGEGYNFMATAAQTVWAYGLNAGDANSIDCQIIFNPSFNFYTGQDASGFSGLDLQSVVTHEITHTLGFSSSYNSMTDLFGYEYAADEYAMQIWDHYLEDGNGNLPDPGSSGTPGDFNQVDAPVYWTGENGNAAYQSMAGVANNAQIPIYAPDPFQSGSSLSHVDELGFDGIGGTGDDLSGMMNYALSAGESYREFNAVEKGMLEDLGWEIIVIPEAGSLLLMAISACAVLLVGRRK
mgnify:CR=1 FL=1